MKDLTHYFQSPVKLVSPTASSSENCTVVKKQSTDQKSSDDNVSPPVCFEKTPEEDSNNLSNGKPCLPSSSPVLCKSKVQTSDSWNGRKRLKISNKNHHSLTSNHKEINETSEQDNKCIQYELKEQKFQSGSSNSVEQHKESDLDFTPFNSQVSPNAFQILMSTQQTFSSSNCGLKESCNGSVENDPSKNESRRKIKENLEKMSKRRLEMEANILACESQTERLKKKRRRIIMESDSENELTAVKSFPVINSDEAVFKTRRKRNKINLEDNMKSKRRKSEKLCDEVFSEAMKTASHKNLNTEVKLLEGQNLKESKSRIEPKFSSTQRDSSENACKPEKQKYSCIDNENNLKVPSPNVGEGINSLEITELINCDAFVGSKKKSNILNYFNKVNNEEKRRHSEKINVTVDVHFPVVSTGKYKKTVLKKKSRRKGQNESMDDIQLIDSEVIEQPDHSVVEVNVISSVASSDARKDKKKPCVSSESVMKTNSDSLSSTPSPKEWKLRIRMPVSSVEHSLSHAKSNKKCKSLVNKRKLKLSSDKSPQNDSCIRNKSDEEINKIASPNIVQKIKEKTKNKIVNSTKEISSNTCLSPTKKKVVARKSTPKKKIIQNTESEYEKASEIESSNMKSADKKGRLSLKTEFSSKFLISSPKKGKAEVKKTTVHHKSPANEIKPRNSPLKCETDHSKNVSRRKHDLKEEHIISKNNNAALTKRKKRKPSISYDESSPVKTDRGGKRHSSVERTPINGKTSLKLVFGRKQTSISQKSKEKKNYSAGVEVINKLVEQNENGDPSSPKKEEISTTGRIRRSCTFKNKDTIVSNEILSQSESLVSRRGNRVSSERSLLGTNNDISIKSENLSCSSPRLRYSTRKRVATTVPDIAISDEDEDDFDADSSDDFIGDSEDDFNDENFENDDDDDLIFEVKKKKVVITQKKIPLDQKIVLQFLKKAKGTLNRKMALNDPKNFPCKELSCEKEKNSVPVKLAPVFNSRKVKKPDRATVLARRTFLQSGVPEVVKKMVEIQRVAEEQEHILFPPISHIQQKENGASVWNLSDALHKFPSLEEVSFLSVPTNMLIDDFKKGKLENSSSEAYSAACPPKIKLFREFLRAIKAESPEFPVYRTFRELFKQNHPEVVNSVKVGPGKKKKRKSNLSNKNNKEGTGDISQDCERGRAVWTAKYRPLTSSSILGNANNVKQLKKWLELWMQVNENTFQKRTKDDVSSGDEFLNDASDDDCGRAVLPKKTAILMGPNGCGKTMAVYTLAHELGYKVLEVNASAKRTGRRILSELLEATQSHQVGGKGDESNTSGIKSFFSSKEKSVKSMVPQTDSDQPTSKLSLLLIEDVDIVFEDEDEGFVSALSTLVIGSKRPVVLVTSDPSCPHLSRFLEQSLVLEFKPPPSKLIGVWLQLVSLLEGVRVRRSSVENLLQYNGGDVRKTLLQLQFWVLSGGDNNKSLHGSNRESPENLDFADDVSNSSWVSVDNKKAENDANHPLHSNCLSTFLIWDPQTLLFNRSKTWWNLPELVGLNHMYHEKSVKNMKEGDQENSTSVPECVISAIECTSDKNGETKNNASEPEKMKWKSVCSMKDLTALVKLADVLSAVESFSYLSDCPVSEPDQNPWEKDPGDSLSLNQDDRPCIYGMKETAQSINNWLVLSSISQCSAQLCPEKKLSLTPVLQQQPPKEEMSWRLQQHNVSKQLGNAVAMLYLPQKRALATDYISTLRGISRLEQDRVGINDKRNNRFFHYLKGLGVETSPEILDAACNVFRCPSES